MATETQQETQQAPTEELKAPTQRTLIICYDIEKTGDSIDSAINAIGIVVGYEDTGEILQTLRLNLQVDWPLIHSATGKVITYGSFDRRCWDEFWSKQSAEFRKSIYVDAQNQTISWREIRRFIDDLEDKYPNDKIKFVSDNPSFDTAALDFFVHRYVDRIPFRYAKTGKYRALMNPNDMMRTFPEDVKSRIVELAANKAAHDHNPLNDALNIFWRYYYVRKARVTVELPENL
jgi:hypothetical protein